MTEKKQTDSGSVETTDPLEFIDPAMHEDFITFVDTGEMSDALGEYFRANEDDVITAMELCLFKHEQFFDELVEVMNRGR